MAFFYFTINMHFKYICAERERQREKGREWEKENTLNNHSDHGSQHFFSSNSFSHSQHELFAHIELLGLRPPQDSRGAGMSLFSSAGTHVALLPSVPPGVLRTFPKAPGVPQPHFHLSAVLHCCYSFSVATPPDQLFRGFLWYPRTECNRERPRSSPLHAFINRNFHNFHKHFGIFIISSKESNESKVNFFILSLTISNSVTFIPEFSLALGFSLPTTFLGSYNSWSEQEDNVLSVP